MKTNQLQKVPTPFAQTYFHGTKSYRSTQPLRVVGEVTVWQGHAEEQVKEMKDRLEKLKEQDINSG